MEGTFSFPVKYGYSWVGHREDGSPVFTMHPHQDMIQVPSEHVLSLPSDVPLPRATLIPNLETALNGWWDAETSGEESMVIVGGGIIGVLLAFVAWSHRGEPARLYEIDPARRATLDQLPWLLAVDSDAVAAERYEVAFHCSGAGEGLQWAIDHVGFEGRVVELSWYGMKPVSLQLGTSFHYDRKRIISSQVSTVSHTRRGPDAFPQRTDQVLDLLSNSALDRIPGPFIPFADLPEAMSRLYRGEQLGLHPVVNYT
jgi:threonine dehydrogenase-like Zn-dependent dehydrogenase